LDKKQSENYLNCVLNPWTYYFLSVYFSRFSAVLSPAGRLTCRNFHGQRSVRGRLRACAVRVFSQLLSGRSSSVSLDRDPVGDILYTNIIYVNVYSIPAISVIKVKLPSAQEAAKNHNQIFCFVFCSSAESD